MTGEGGGAVTSLELGPDVMAELERIVGRSREDGLEHCGVLFGNVREDDGARIGMVLGSAELQNVAREPAHQYEFKPEHQAMVWGRVEGNGMEVLGIWHTHPVTGPYGLSGTDLAHMQPWLVYPILWPTEHGCAMGVYRIAPGDPSGEGSITVEVVAYTVA